MKVKENELDLCVLARGGGEYSESVLHYTWKKEEITASSWKSIIDVLENFFAIRSPDGADEYKFGDTS